ncbi:hypothetical protein [Saccharothrix deserti]|uniref:hypothetical protein n=1 Tax=Saccharothrix deserti TaxID=2593674 RepID=UPI001EE42157|nr:hypothetical protein [Saccharothrix deserti]
MDLLEAGRDPRVVTVASMVHRRGRIHFEDLTGTRHYSPMPFYRQSKFATVAFGLELHRSPGFRQPQLHPAPLQHRPQFPHLRGIKKRALVLADHQRVDPVRVGRDVPQHGHGTPRRRAPRTVQPCPTRRRAAWGWGQVDRHLTHLMRSGSLPIGLTLAGIAGVKGADLGEPTSRAAQR